MKVIHWYHLQKEKYSRCDRAEDHRVSETKCYEVLLIEINLDWCPFPIHLLSILCPFSVILCQFGVHMVSTWCPLFVKDL